MLHAYHLVYQQPDKQVVELHHQHPPLLARPGQLKAREPPRSITGSKRPRRLATPLTQGLTPGIKVQRGSCNTSATSPMGAT